MAEPAIDPISNGAPSYLDPLKANPELAPLVEKVQEKDFESFFKSKINLEQRLGDSVYLKDRPESITAKLRERGILPKPPESYTIKRPENLPEGAWNDALEAKAHEWGKRHGLSQAAVDEALGLYMESFAGFAEPLMKSREEAEAAFVKRMTAEGKDPVRVAEGAKRWAETNIKDEKLREKLSNAGLMDDPDVVNLLYQAAEASGQFDTRNDEGSNVDNQATGDEAFKEANDIVRNKANPKYEAYHKGDPEVAAYVEALYKKARPGTMEL